jgi:hypothetical protein
MTRNEILNMPAGREMDELIRLEILDLEVFTTPEGKLLGEGTFQEIPHYSTDIAAAWEVVEKMRINDWEFYLEWENQPWALFENDKCMLDKCAEAITVPLAICRAALLAVLESDND